MSIALTDSPNFTISRTGLEVHNHLSFDEWASLAPLLNEAARGVAFVIGDWLNYGHDRFGREESGKRGNDVKEGQTGKQTRLRRQEYDAAIRLTGLDRTTLHNYAWVARRTDSSLRNELLSWEHHRVVAKLPPADQQRWLTLAAEPQEDGRPVSTRRLRRSISAGRLLDADEVDLPENDRGIENHIPFVNRLVAWWGRMRERGWKDEATPEQRAALKRDLEPVMEIYREL